MSSTQKKRASLFSKTPLVPDSLRPSSPPLASSAEGAHSPPGSPLLSGHGNDDEEDRHESERTRRARRALSPPPPETGREKRGFSPPPAPPTRAVSSLHLPTSKEHQQKTAAKHTKESKKHKRTLSPDKHDHASDRDAHATMAENIGLQAARAARMRAIARDRTGEHPAANDESAADTATTSPTVTLTTAVYSGSSDDNTTHDTPPPSPALLPKPQLIKRMSNLTAQSPLTTTPLQAASPPHPPPPPSQSLLPPSSSSSSSSSSSGSSPIPPPLSLSQANPQFIASQPSITSASLLQLSSQHSPSSTPSALALALAGTSSSPSHPASSLSSTSSASPSSSSSSPTSSAFTTTPPLSTIFTSSSTTTSALFMPTTGWSGAVTSIREGDGEHGGNSSSDVMTNIDRCEGGKYVRLNIGGVRYDTTVGTLLRVRSTRGSFFSGLLSGNFEPIKDSEGAYFIDRDGLPFGPILRFLRTGEFVLPDELSLREVQREAEFYCIPIPTGGSLQMHCNSTGDCEPRFDGVYMDKDRRLLIQFLPAQNRVKIAAKLDQNTWLDFCRTNDSYFRYTQTGRFFIISPVGIQDEYSVFAGALYPTYLQPDTFCRLSSFGRLVFLASNRHIAVPRFDTDYVLSEEYAFKTQGETSHISVRISMIAFSATGICSMIVKIGSQPQRVKTFPYEICEVADRPHDDLLAAHVRPSASAPNAPSPLPSSSLSPSAAGSTGPMHIVAGAPASDIAFSPGSPPERFGHIPSSTFSGDESDHDDLHELATSAPAGHHHPPPPLPAAHQPIGRDFMLKEVVIRSAALTKTDIYLLCLDSNILVEVSFFIGMRSARTYHPRITRVFVEAS